MGNRDNSYDFFHELIAHEEMARIGAYGVMDGIKTGFSIGLPPVLTFGKIGLKNKIVKEIMEGKKMICLAVTDDGAGSDVAGLGAKAVKSPCGKFYIVNGRKKWITNGTFADYFCTAVRTGGPGVSGISMLII